MSDLQRKIEGMLFNYETSNRTDFRDGEIRPIAKTTYKEKPRCLMIRPPPLKDIHTLSDWKTATIPFDLLHKPRDIIDTNPTNVQQPYSKPPDKDREEAIKTRPRLVMTPAVSMDDIEDPKAREILCDDMYTTDTTRAQREAVSSYFCIRAPLPGRPAPSNPIKLRKIQAPYVSPEWRMESVSWDRRQLRAHCDPTKEFWLAHKTPQCRPCDETATVAAHRKMLAEIKKGKH